MLVTVKLFAGFQKNRFAVQEGDYPVGTTVQNVVDKLRIVTAEIGVVMINHRHVEMVRELEPGDVIAIFPVIGGG